MPIRVLIVEDSGFFRRRLEEILKDDEIEVCGVAVNGQEAVSQVEKLKPDVITMDVEMPVMDGITAVRQIMAKKPTPILMFSSLTFEGAQATIDALEAGALDFLPKRFEDVVGSKEEGKKLLVERVRALARRGLPLGNHRPSAREIAAQRREAEKNTPAPSVPGKRSVALSNVDFVAVGSSTGGPVALQRILTKLPKGFPVPMVVVQHMPASFTSAFAQRLNDLCALEVAEAKEGDEITSGRVLLAPGGRQMGFTRSSGKLRVRLFDEGPDQVYKPCVDTAFKQLSDINPGRVLAMILTGMGADGREGCRLLKQQGGTVWAQDEASSVIFGMPGAVVKAGLADRVLALDSIAEELMK
jgi:two-component system, chemotaxis family, protein-glutamate methylesterase/glutaminase